MRVQGTNPCTPADQVSIINMALQSFRSIHRWSIPPSNSRPALTLMVDIKTPQYVQEVLPHQMIGRHEITSSFRVHFPNNDFRRGVMGLQEVSSLWHIPETTLQWQKSTMEVLHLLHSTVRQRTRDASFKPWKWTGRACQTQGAGFPMFTDRRLVTRARRISWFPCFFRPLDGYGMRATPRALWSNEVGLSAP